MQCAWACAPFQCYRAVVQRLFVAASAICAAARALHVAAGAFHVNSSASEQAPSD